MNKRLMTVVGLLSALPVLAQLPMADTAAVKSISLADAQAMALANNAEVVNSQIDVDIAQKKIWETTAIGLPQLKGEFSYTFTPDPMDYSEFNGQAPGTIVDKKLQGNYSFTLSQLVFSGEYIVGLKASKTYKRFSEENLEAKKADMKEKVANSYYMALAMDENLRLLDSSMLLMKASVDEMAITAKVGFAQGTDADQMQLNYVSMQNQRANLARQALFARRTLSFNLGLPLENNLLLAQSLDELILSSNVAASDSGTFDPAAHVSGRQLQTNEDLQSLSYKRTQSTYLPTLAAYYRHKGFVEEPIMSFEPKDVAGVTLSWDLFTSGQRCSKVQQAKMEFTKAQNTKLQGQEGLKLAVMQAESDFRNALNIYSSEKLKLELSQKIFGNYLIKQKNGMASSMDVTTAQNQLIQSQTAYITAAFDVLRLKSALDKAKGTM